MRFQRAGQRMTDAQRGRLNEHMDGLQKSLQAAGKAGKLAALFKKQQAKEEKLVEEAVVADDSSSGTTNGDVNGASAANVAASLAAAAAAAASPAVGGGGGGAAAGVTAAAAGGIGNSAELETRLATIDASASSSLPLPFHSLAGSSKLKKLKLSATPLI
jgi:phage tail sheath gpL-like